MGGLIFLIAVLAVGAPKVQVSTVDGRVVTGLLQEVSGRQISSSSTLAGVSVDDILSIVPSTSLQPTLDKPVAWI